MDRRATAGIQRKVRSDLRVDLTGIFYLRKGDLLLFKFKSLPPCPPLLSRHLPASTNHTVMPPLHIIQCILQPLCVLGTFGPTHWQLGEVVEGQREWRVVVLS